MPFWIKVIIYLAIGIVTALVIVWCVEAEGEKRGEILTRNKRRNLALLAGTIAICWPGFYAVLVGWLIPPLRRLIVRYVETGKLRSLS